MDKEDVRQLRTRDIPISRKGDAESHRIPSEERLSHRVSVISEDAILPGCHGEEAEPRTLDEGKRSRGSASQHTRSSQRSRLQIHIEEAEAAYESKKKLRKIEARPQEARRREELRREEEDVLDRYRLEQHRKQVERARHGWKPVPELEIADERGLPINKKFYNSGSTIELKCLVSNIPDKLHFIMWRLGDRVLNYDQTRGGITVKNDVYADGVMSRLFIANSNQQDSGNYTCSLGEMTQASVTVVVLTGESPAAMHVSRANLLVNGIYIWISVPFIFFQYRVHTSSSNTHEASLQRIRR